MDHQPGNVAIDHQCGAEADPAGSSDPRLGILLHTGCWGMVVFLGNGRSDRTRRLALLRVSRLLYLDLTCLG